MDRYFSECECSEANSSNTNNGDEDEEESTKEDDIDETNETNTDETNCEEVPLTAEIIMQYKNTVECERIDQFIFCQLQRHKITCIDDTLETNLFSALRTLDLSFNAITHVS